MTVHLRSPFPVTFPTNSSTTQWTDEVRTNFSMKNFQKISAFLFFFLKRSENLIQEFNRQLKVHLETIDVGEK